jgi:glycosyltransferase involved in cell wall biosynthesis
VRNGLDLNEFRRSEHFLAAINYVAAVGSLFPVKRWDRLLRAIHRIKHIGACNVRFRIAGDGPLRSDLEKLAQTLGVSQHVEFIGECYDIPAFLREAKFLVHTSESEGCPNVVMEAMACGLAVVAMEAGDISCIVEDGRCGFLVEQGDEETLAERMKQLLTDEALCVSMGLASRERAEKEFSLPRLVSATLNAYRTAGWNG